MSGVDKQSRDYKTGIVAELKVAARLTRDGCLVALVKHGSDLAPALRGWGRHVTLPDIQACWPRTRQMTWVEVKWKSTTGVVRVMDDLKTTGIDAADFAAYREIERITGHQVVLVFLHEAQDEVRLATLDQYLVPALGKGKSMVYWDYARLKLLCSYDALMRTRPREQHLEPPLFAPPEPRPVQLGLFDGGA